LPASGDGDPVKHLPRVLPALVTPFDRRGEIDLASHRHNLALLWAGGVRGFLIGGSTGEGPYLEPGERRTLVAAAREELGASAYLMCGVAAESLRRALSQAAEAADGGADTCLVLTPTTLVRGRAERVQAFFEEVADAARIPVLLYSVPQVTGYELPVEIALDLSMRPGVVGIKDSGGHPVRSERMARDGAPGFRVMNGSSAAVALTIAAGAHGAITASANYAWELVGEVVTTAGRSPARALEPQGRLTALAGFVEADGVAGTKAAAAARGLAPGRPRRPLRPLPAARRRAIARRVGEG
jgi:4-hydroxy-tetrahydrodipicolinate synthase